MAGPKRVALPAVLTGNDLHDGDVVYYDGEGFTRNLSEALVATDEAGGERLRAVLAEIEADGRLVLPYLMKAKLDDNGRPAADHYRDRIRRSGPTVQAGRIPEGSLNVPL